MTIWIRQLMLWLLCMLLTMGWMGCAERDLPDPAIFDMKDGTYEGYGDGHGGIIKISMDVSNHLIVSAKVLLQSESPFAQESIQQMIARIIELQSADKADVITGATITTTGVKDAMAMAIRACRGEIVPQPEYSDTSCDVVIVGGGGAGLTAAIEASSSGAKVIVLEKQGVLGGNTNSSTGGINAAGTRWQQKLSIADSQQLFFDDTMKGGKWLNDSSLVRTLVQNAPSTLYWLSDFDVDLSDVGLMAGSSQARTHRPQGGQAIGPHLMMKLKKKVKELGIDVRTSNKVTDVLMGEHGEATGVKVEPNGREPYTIKAGAVIIATGGFGANLPEVVALRPDLTGYPTVNHPGAMGDAFEWVKKFKAHLYQLEQIQTHPTADRHNFILVTEAVRGNGAILFNRDGQRFVNELNTRDVVAKAIWEQSDHSAFLFFDQNVRQSLLAIETYASQGLLVEGATVSDVALALNLDPDRVNATVSKYNVYQKNGKDEEFGRTAIQMPCPLAVPPFYAIEVLPAIHHTMGGIRIDRDTQVLTENGLVIPGLFAAGEVTGGVHGGNRLGGNGVADIVVFGRIAGRTAATFAKTKK